MKRTFLTLAATLALAAASLAGPLNKQQVAADAKWLLHLDLEALLQTGLGKWIAETLLEPELARPRRDLRQWGVEFDWRQLRSVTAYGTQYKPAGEPTGVLLFQGFDFGRALDQAIQALELVLPAGDLPLQKVQEDSGSVYSLRQELFGAALPGNRFLLSKSSEELQKARDVLTGAAPNLGARKTAPGLPDPARAGFLYAQAQSLEQAPLPPQARALKHVRSARLALGEEDETVSLKLTLETKDAEAAAQMQQALQGLLALAALSQPDNPNAQKLVQAAKLTGNGRLVTVKLDLPTQDVIAMIEQGRIRRATSADPGQAPRPR